MATDRRIARTILLGSAALLALAAFGRAAAGGGQAKAGKTYSPNMANCAGFTSADAAKLLGLPAAQIVSKTDEIHETLWICSFTGGGKSVSFSVAVAKSVKEAVADMAELRGHLGIAGETAPFKDKLPKGAYSDISGIGDDAVWTDVNGTLTVRKGNVTVQVLTPSDKMEQIKVAQAFLAKL